MQIHLPPPSLTHTNFWLKQRRRNVAKNKTQGTGSQHLNVGYPSQAERGEKKTKERGERKKKEDQATLIVRVLFFSAVTKETSRWKLHVSCR